MDGKCILHSPVSPGISPRYIHIEYTIYFVLHYLFHILQFFFHSCGDSATFSHFLDQDLQAEIEELMELPLGFANLLRGQYITSVNL